MSAAEKLKALNDDLAEDYARAKASSSPELRDLVERLAVARHPSEPPDFVDHSVVLLNALPQIVAVVEAAEAIQRNRVFLGDFPELDQAMAYLENELS